MDEMCDFYRSYNLFSGKKLQLLVESQISGESTSIKQNFIDELRSNDIFFYDLGNMMVIENFELQINEVQLTDNLFKKLIYFGVYFYYIDDVLFVYFRKQRKFEDIIDLLKKAKINQEKTDKIIKRVIERGIAYYKTESEIIDNKYHQLLMEYNKLEKKIDEKVITEIAINRFKWENDYEYQIHCLKQRIKLLLEDRERLRQEKNKITKMYNESICFECGKAMKLDKE